MPTTPSMLDIRPLPPAQRHTRIFALLDALAPGEDLILVNDHDPKRLRYQVQVTQPGCFTWESRETTPHEWTVHIRRLELTRFGDSPSLLVQRKGSREE